MSEEIDVQKVAKLARLKLTEEEERVVGQKFKDVLGYIATLEEVEITGELAGKDESEQVLYRPDKNVVSPVKPEDFSPHMENGFFKVPKVIE
ncbi:MAG: Asp-tRNA(Asn)/Glu-tRNA(Gln) amidotransferase subunit GatC [SAR324 cluster bacterium]|nr:Asp-tRNA(Asn)/Glu-tRNA(Gln) amidotransferase subunit GatC [SAR324 cluster bacterium]